MTISPVILDNMGRISHAESVGSVVFLSLQKYFIEGIATTGLKG